MTLLLREADLDGIASPALAVRSLEHALRVEAAGQADVPPRLTTGSPESWLRLMPAVMDGGGDGGATMGFKAMNLRKGTGVRYMVLLYDQGTGELVSILDAARITRLRTAAFTALACRAARPQPLESLALFGSGHEATSHAEVFKTLWPELRKITVFSRSAGRRESFAREVAERFELEVVPVADPQEAATASEVVLLATKAPEPVCRTEWFAPGTLLLSIGSTRLDLRELDEALFARTEVVLCDAPEQVIAESGDVAAALHEGHVDRDALVRLADVVTGERALAWPPRDLLLFKSVGTALQDLAVSAAVLRECRAAGRGIDLGGFPAVH